MGEFNFVSTIHKPTTVTHSLVGKFTSLDFDNLIVSKYSQVEIHKISSDAIELIHEFPTCGKIQNMALFPSQDEPLDHLLIITNQMEGCVLKWDANSGLLVTRSSMDYQRLGGERETPLKDQPCIVDRLNRCLGVLLCADTFQIIPIDNNEEFKPSHRIRLGSSEAAKDIKFLYGCTKPTVAVLYQNEWGSRITRYAEGRANRYEGAVSHELSNRDYDLLIPVPTPLCGFLLIGKKRIGYHPDITSKKVLVNPPALKEKLTEPSAHKVYGRIDDFRYLLGDDEGHLHLLVVSHENERVTDLTYKLLGETSIASTLSYLQNSLVFVGSISGDSQLIKVNLVAEEEEEGSGVEVLRNFINLGPIVDFCVVNREKPGIPTEIVTCSGKSKDGSLRILSRKMTELASQEIEGITGLWALKCSIGEEALDKFLVASFINETRILSISLDKVEETEIEGFLSPVKTLFCHDAVYSQLVQVTSNCVRLVSSTTRQLLTKWDTPNSLPLNIATGNASQVLLASEKDEHLYYLEIEDGKLTGVKHIRLDFPASCLNINPIGDDALSSNVASVGTWKDRSVRILKLPELTVLTMSQIGEESIAVARSVLLCAFEEALYLFCGLGDGNLVIFQLDKDTRAIVGRKELLIGSHAISLNSCSLKGVKCVLAASDRSTVIYSSNKKLSYKELSYKELLDLGGVNHMCQINSGAFPESIAIATGDKLTLGNIDIQKFGIQTIPLGECAVCICHQAQTCTFAICTESKAGWHGVRLIEDKTYQFLSVYNLGAQEYGLCIASCLFDGESQEFYIVGTGIANAKEEIEGGRILVLRVKDYQLILVAQERFDDEVFSIDTYRGKLVAAVGSKAILFKWNARELESQGEWKSVHENALIQTRGDLVLVGDNHGTLILLKNKLEKQDKFYIANSPISAIGMLEDDFFMCADYKCNLYVLRQSVTGKLKLVGRFILGSAVNRFRVMVNPLDGDSQTATVFCTNSGMIGVTASLPRTVFETLENLQAAVRSSSFIPRRREAPMEFDLIDAYVEKEEMRPMEWDLVNACLEEKERQEPKAKSYVDFVNGDLINAYLDGNEMQEDICMELDMLSLEELYTVDRIGRLSFKKLER